MARVTVEDCLKQVPNRMELIILAAKRTRQLLDKENNQVGPLISNDQGNKEPVVALREISAGKIYLKQVDGVKTRKTFRRRRRISRYIRGENED
ncbi:DNA-directed RNA polymerase subunit omega [bacterium]|nr:DNA-directed RNA polymerase subunit omega [bacterium]MBP5434367.1 DNA-directed RNA polymerase subunit omega [bacterium]MBR6245164.1 DNA-directed RNA polymerase subunit omega [bacterium]